MNRRGSMLLDAIIGIFIIGLIVMTLFPIYSLIQKGFNKNKSMAQMSYISEAIIENLKLKDEQALEFLETLETRRELEYPFLEEDGYISIVKLINDNSYLWDLNILVKETKGGEANVELKATIPK